MDKGDGSRHSAILGAEGLRYRARMASHEPALATGSQRPGRRPFAVALLALVLVGAATRLWFAVGVAPDLPLPGDATVYRQMAANLADGHGLALTGIDTPGLQPSAEHPPLFPALLAALDRVGLGALDDHRRALAVLTSISVALMGVLGRRLAGPICGLLAAAVAALHPLWFQSAGVVMSESVHLVLVPAVLSVGLWVMGSPRPRRFVALGVTIGAAGLVRPEALGLLAAVGFPVLVGAHERWRPRLIAGGILVISAAMVVAPWLIRNQLELGTPAMSTNAGKTLLGSNCSASYSGPGLGGFDYDCFFGAATVLRDYGTETGAPWNGATFDEAMGDAGWRFIRGHRGELPKVIVARTARMWGLAFAEDQLRFDVDEGRDRGLQRIGQVVHLVLLVPAAVGAVALARARRSTFLVVVGPVLLVTLTVLLVYGGTRMRTGAEPSIALLAAHGAVVGWRCVGRWRAVPPVA